MKIIREDHPQWKTNGGGKGSGSSRKSNGIAHRKTTPK
jgi:hypothetical protein